MELLREGVAGAMPAINDHLQRALKGTTALAKALLAAK
jgi:hypothetical protein